MLRVSLIVMVLFTLSGCGKTRQPTQENPLLGKWRDTYGLTEYEFLDGENLKLIVRGVAPFGGTYEIIDGHFIVSYDILGQQDRKTYEYRYEGNRFFLDQNEFVREKT